MQGSKIRLSAAETELISNAEVILTKNSIIKKTVLLLSEVREGLLNETSIKGYELAPSPKISKGENYSGLPYVILDYPRIAKDKNLFFIRSMFWWGNFFSSTLQLSGYYKMAYKIKLKEGYEALSEQHYFIGVSDDPWMHHFGEDNYKKISSLSKETFAAILETAPHIKIAAYWPLSDWDSAASKLKESWKLLIGLVT
jgi:hypothetical protein